MVMQIRKLREAANLTQIQLALDMGVTQGMVSMWETEVALPKSRDLPLLAKVLGCEIGALFAPEDEDDEPAC